MNRGAGNYNKYKKEKIIFHHHYNTYKCVFEKNLKNFVSLIKAIAITTNVEIMIGIPILNKAPTFVKINGVKLISVVIIDINIAFLT
jgi:agmatine/peptidylarginine deiminase